MPIANAPQMMPTMMPQGVNPDGSRSISVPITIDPPSYSRGSNPQMATAFQGLLSDTRAVMQETKKTMKEMGILAQRINAMVGGAGLAASSGGPDVPDISARKPLMTDAVSAAHSGLAYGSGIGVIRPMASSQGVYAQALQVPGTASTIPGMSAAGASFNVQNQVAPNTSSSPGTNVPVISSPTTAPAPSSAPSDPEQDKRIRRAQEAADAALARSFGEGQQKGGSIQQIAQQIESVANRGGVGSRLYDRSQFLFGTRDATGKVVEGQTGGLIGRLAEGATAGKLGASVAGAIGGDALLKGLGVAGLAVGAVEGVYHFGGDWLTGQRAQNATFQSMEGGSNLAALSERARQQVFEMQQFGTFTSQQADQIFQGVTATGLRGAARTSGLDFVSHNYKNMGMSTQDSIQFLQEAVQAGVTGFTQLAQTLQNVTDTAASASINTENARQTFQGMYTQLLGQGVGAGTAATVAGATTNTISRLGLVGQGVKSLPTGSVQLQAALVGKSVGEYVADTMGNSPAAAALKLRGQQAVMNQVFGPLSSPAVSSALRSGNTQQAIKDFYESSNFTPQELEQYAKEFGYGGTVQGVEKLFTSWGAGKVNLVKSGQEEARQIQAKNRDSAKEKAWLKAHPGWHIGEPNTLSQWVADGGNAVKKGAEYVPGAVGQTVNDVTGIFGVHISNPFSSNNLLPEIAKAKKARSKNAHDAADNGGTNKSRDSQSGTVKVKIEADPSLQNLLHIVGSYLPTSAYQTMGNPTSPSPIKDN